MKGFAWLSRPPEMLRAAISGSSQKGFTLIELLVVVLIIGILAAVALPQYQMAVYKTRFQKIRPLLHSLADAQAIYYMANGRYADDWRDLDVSFPAGCTYSVHADYAYDEINCPDVYIRAFHNSSGAAVAGRVKGCPKFPSGCVEYLVPGQYGSAYFGRKPSCIISAPGGFTQEAKEYGQKVCLALGGTFIPHGGIQQERYELP